MRGTITFESSIEQLITTSAGLQSSEAMYGLTDQIDYGYRRFTGLEWPDAVTYSGNELDFRLTAIDPGDHMRVLTQAVPEPSSLAMLAFGLSAMGVAARRRRRV